MRRSVLPLLLLAALTAVSLASAAPTRSGDTNLTIVGYSIPTSVFPKLTAAYQATPAGDGVKFASSFAASEVQSKAVAAGLPADVVNFSIETDMNRLVDAKLVDKSWANNRYHGIVSKSVVVFVLRNGNPKHIRTWDDLVKPGVGVVFPNPFSSGGARWDVMAAYGAMKREGKSERLAGHERPQRAQHVPFGPGRRPARLRERCEARSVAGQARLLPDSEGDAADRDPTRGRQQQQQGRGAEVRQLAVHAARSDDLGAERVPAGRRERLAQVREAVSTAPVALQDRLRRRVEPSEHAVLRSDERDRHEDRAESGGLHWRLTSRDCRGRSGAPSAPPP